MELGDETIFFYLEKGRNIFREGERTFFSEMYVFNGIHYKELGMKKAALVLMVIAGILVSQSVFAQDSTAVKKKVEKVAKVKKEAGKVTKEKKQCKEKMECCKDEKCCDKCAGEKCDGNCCDKCAKCKKGDGAKCEKEKKEKCAMDSTATCKMKDMKKHMGKKSPMKEKATGDEKK